MHDICPKAQSLRSECFTWLYIKQQANSDYYPTMLFEVHHWYQVSVLKNRVSYDPQVSQPLSDPSASRNKDIVVVDIAMEFWKLHLKICILMPHLNGKS